MCHSDIEILQKGASETNDLLLNIARNYTQIFS